ncbi:hypothetical protein [Streptomyces carpinensis]|uniref:Uncharacterized protein n=1 Tax=Streptomyces carpinensis TaxID=66369 RepID=A0ABV1VVS5_9ACTN|nr:hypothetical protein [Streptomyces carpinensis]
MTGAGRAAFVAYCVVFLAASGKGAVLLHERAPLDMVGAAYAVALVCLVALCREIGRASLEELRVRFRPNTCDCDLWWTSMGRFHDDWCRTNRSKH